MADGNQSGEALRLQHPLQMNGQNGVPNQQQQLQPGVLPQQPFVPRPPVDPMTQMMGMMQQMMQQMQLQMQQQSAAFQQQQVAAQQQLREHQDMIRELAANRGPIPHHPEQILDALASNIKDFRYDPESSVTFAVWFSRYEELFEKDATRLDGDAKVRLLLRKLGEVEHERYTSYILPKKSKDFSFTETVETLKGLFGAKESVVSKRYRCLQITKQPTEDHVTYACRVNKLCVEFELGKLTEDQFKCLVYVCGLKSESDAEIRTRLLSKIEEQADVTLQQLSDECQRLLNLKHDNAMIEEQPLQVNKIQQQRVSREREKRKERSPSSSPVRETRDRNKWACWLCGGMHVARNCKYHDHRCSDCDEIGHREGYCRSAQLFRPRREKKKTETVTSNVISTDGAVPRGRKFVSVELDGKPVRLQLDTGSDVTVISKKLWKKIGSPYLEEPSVDVKAASGTALALVGEFYCDVTIAGMTHFEVIRVSEKTVHLLGLDLLESFELGSVPADSYCCNMLKSKRQQRNEGTSQRCYARDDLVQARVFSGGLCKWMSGVVVENIGSKTYNVWLEDGRMLRSHICQLRDRLVTMGGVPSTVGRR